MLFKKDKKHTIKKIDAIITSVIVGGVIASVYGIKKYDQNKKEQILPKSDESDSQKIMTKRDIIKALIFGNKKDSIKKSNYFIRIFGRFLGKK